LEAFSHKKRFSLLRQAMAKGFQLNKLGMKKPPSQERVAGGQGGSQKGEKDPP